MPRAIWTGSIAFGLVNVPVRAFPAVKDQQVHFHQLEAGTGSRIKYQKVSAASGEPVDAENIEKGYEISRGKYVVVDPDELDALRPKTTHAIDIEDFVELQEIDPVYYAGTYWLAPDGEAAKRAYGLLLKAMEKEGRVGIGHVVMRNKQYLAAVRPLDGALAMSTMRFADEVRAADDLDIDVDKPSEKEMKLATSMIDSLTVDWDPKKYKDTYTEQLRDLIAKKADGEEITAEVEEERPAKVLDLMAALEASVSAAREGAKKPAKRATRARKSA